MQLVSGYCYSSTTMFENNSHCKYSTSAYSQSNSSYSVCINILNSRIADRMVWLHIDGFFSICQPNFWLHCHFVQLSYHTKIIQLNLNLFYTHLHTLKLLFNYLASMDLVVIFGAFSSCVNKKKRDVKKTKQFIFHFQLLLIAHCCYFFLLFICLLFFFFFSLNPIQFQRNH